VKTAKRVRRKTEAEVLERATNSLLASLKKDMLAKEGRVDYDKLRKEGYSESTAACIQRSGRQLHITNDEAPKASR
jgi:hypothetical protein